MPWSLKKRSLALFDWVLRQRNAKKPNFLDYPEDSRARRQEKTMLLLECFVRYFSFESFVTYLSLALF
jgi:hypothetical protein